MFRSTFLNSNKLYRTGIRSKQFPSNECHFIQQPFRAAKIKMVIVYGMLQQNYISLAPSLKRVINFGQLQIFIERQSPCHKYRRTRRVIIFNDKRIAAGRIFLLRGT